MEARTNGLNSNWRQRRAAGALAFGLLLSSPLAYGQMDPLHDGDRLMGTTESNYQPKQNEFIARCPLGQQIAGFDVRVGDPKGAGDGIFSIRPICFTAFAAAAAGPLNLYPSSRGGAGGTRTLRLMCPGELPVLTKMRIEVDEESDPGSTGTWGNELAVNGIGLHCGLVGSPQGRGTAGPSYSGALKLDEHLLPGHRERSRNWGFADTVFVDHSGYHDAEGRLLRWGNSSCADDLVAVGISGQQSKVRLLALGLVCGKPTVIPQGAVRPTARVKGPGDAASGPARPICDLARDARARNSPAAPGLEAKCLASTPVNVPVSPSMDIDALAARGEELANQDPLALELRNQQPDSESVRGFDIGMASAAGQTAPGPGKQRIHDALPREQQAGFSAAVAYTLTHNQHAELAATGASIAESDPDLAEARGLEADVFYRLGFDIATGIFGDPALGARGNTATGPGSLAIRGALTPPGQRGFDAATALHLSREYGR